MKTYNKKPVCSMCGKKGEDKYYYWSPDQRGSGGMLSHVDCLIKLKESTGNFGRKE